MSILAEGSNIVDEDGRTKEGERQDPERATKRDVLFSPVASESHIERLRYRDDETGAVVNLMDTMQCCEYSLCLIITETMWASPPA